MPSCGIQARERSRANGPRGGDAQIAGPARSRAPRRRRGRRPWPRARPSGRRRAGGVRPARRPAPRRTARRAGATRIIAAPPRAMPTTTPPAIPAAYQRTQAGLGGATAPRQPVRAQPGDALSRAVDQVVPADAREPQSNGRTNSVVVEPVEAPAARASSAAAGASCAPPAASCRAPPRTAASASQMPSRATTAGASAATMSPARPPWRSGAAGSTRLEEVGRAPATWAQPRGRSMKPRDQRQRRQHVRAARRSRGPGR